MTPFEQVNQTNEQTPAILFFDSWTRGAHNFKRVVDGIPQGKASFNILHFGRLRDPLLPKCETLHGISTADISLFPGKSLLEVLQIYDPAVIVNLNAWYLWDRALFACARRLNIPTVYLQHGAMAEPDVMETVCRHNDANWRLRDYISRLPKYANVIKWYLGGKGERVPTRLSLEVLGSLLRYPTRSMVHPYAAHELWPDVALVYAESEVDRLVKHWQLPRDRIRIVGNPELDEAFVRSRIPLDISARERVFDSLGLALNRPVIFCPDEGWAANGTFGWTVESTRRWYADLDNAAGQLGAQVLVRPRPADGDLRGPNGRVYLVKDLCEGLPNVIVSRSSTVCEATEIANVVIGMMSTVIETAVAMRRPILVPAWGFSDSPIDASPYVRFGAARVIKSQQDLAADIRKALADPEVVISPAFARQRLGPPDGGALSRIVAEILAAASKRHHSSNGRLD